MGFFLYLQNQQNKAIMKLRIITLGVLGLLLYSCASKTPAPAPVAEVKAETAPKGVMTQELAEGLSLYENNCAKCHKLYNPKSFSSEQWKPILVDMQKNTNLNDAQMVSISDYINSQL